MKAGIYPLERLAATIGLPLNSYLPEKIYKRKSFSINSEFLDENFLIVWKMNMKNNNTYNISESREEEKDYEEIHNEVNDNRKYKDKIEKERKTLKLIHGNGPFVVQNSEDNNKEKQKEKINLEYIMLEEEKKILN
jgi:hypothetical protein